MHAVLLDFNGTMFFDSSLHMEAWSKIFHVLHPDEHASPDTSLFCGPRNDVILQSIAPWLTDGERERYSEEKEAVYRSECRVNSELTHLVPGVEDFLQYLKKCSIPCILASASIKANIDFFFDTFDLGRWFDRELVVYDDGTYGDKGEMYLEAAGRLNVNISDCLIIEDSPSSIRLAKQLQPDCIVAVGQTASSEELLKSGADYYIRDFTEFNYAWLKHE